MTSRNNLFYELLQERKALTVGAKMRIADSMKKLPLPSNSIDLIITSPPYVTSYEYADLHQLSLLWFGNDKTYFKRWGRHIQDFNGFRKKFIGTNIRKHRKSEFLNSPIAEETVSKLLDEDFGIGSSVAHYFSDMNRSLNELFRILKPKSRACIIIGNTSMRGVEVKNASVTTEQMQRIGFRDTTFIKREIPNKGIAPWRDSDTGKFTGIKNPNKIRAYQYEYILVMEKP